MSDTGRRTRQRTEEGSSILGTPRHSPPPSAGHSTDLLRLDVTQNIESLFDTSSLSDVELVVIRGDQERRFKCHKVILASMSTYFQALFTTGMQESSQSEVVLKGVDPDLCEKVLRMLYGQPVEITQESLLTFVHLADFYGINQLLCRTGSLLEEFVTIGACNCCAKLVEASALRCTQAQQHCRRVVLQDFAAAAQQAAFVQLELGIIAELLEDDELRCDREEVVLTGLWYWWSHQEPPLPVATLDRLLELIRWPLLSTECLSGVEASHPSFKASAMLPQLMLEGFRYHSADSHARTLMRATQPRCRPRVGMLSLLPLLPDGPWEAPPGFTPPPSTGAEGLQVPSSFSYVWNIPHFSSLSCLSMYSPAFVANGHLWKIYVYPKGNNNHNHQLSVYLDSGITDSHESLSVKFRLVVVNYKAITTPRGQPLPPDSGYPMHAAECAIKEASHCFCKRAKDWGFREFMPLEQQDDPKAAYINDPRAGFLNEGTLSLGVHIETLPP